MKASRMPFTDPGDQNGSHLRIEANTVTIEYLLELEKLLGTLAQNPGQVDKERVNQIFGFGLRLQAVR